MIHIILEIYLPIWKESGMHLMLAAGMSEIVISTIDALLNGQLTDYIQAVSQTKPKAKAIIGP